MGRGGAEEEGGQAEVVDEVLLRPVKMLEAPGTRLSEEVEVSLEPEVG